uniref:Probable ribosomal RNA small subunit methyltransferase A n=1 Tax=Geoglobus ahangari TaxID=113653 RepID=A0A7C4W3Y1_9EURY
MKLLKRLGQHILISKPILKKIINYAEISDKDTVLEVGCGTGNLTEMLLKKARKVIGIEKDGRFIDLLEKKFKKEIKESRLELIEANALKIEWPSFDKFVSNIPYKISSPLTFKLFKHDYKLAVIMYQKEFAERLTASCGSKKYGKLSVIAKIYCKAEILDIVPPEAFRPKPKVYSAIVRIIPKPEIDVRNKKLFEDFVRFVFTKRRKKFGKIAQEYGIMVPDDLKDKRPEEIPPEVFAKIVDDISSV